MSCILSISGVNFDVDEFVRISQLQPYKVSHKGELLFKRKPNGSKLKFSSISIETSDADFDNLKTQIADTILYLKENRNKLEYIKSAKGIDRAVLDFGIELRIDKKKILTQSEIFPSELLKLAGELEIDVEFSLYPIDQQTILDEKRKKRIIRD